MHKNNSFGLIALVLIVSVLGFMKVVTAATSVGLGTADSFAVLAGSAVTNTGPSVINGDLGLSPGTSVTGFPPGTLNGTQHVTNATALSAQADLITAYNDAAGQSPTTNVVTELGGTTKTAGAYDSEAGTFGITGTLTLDAQGDADAVFIFKTASTLITASQSVVHLINGAQACNVYWQVGSSATLGTSSTFVGNILALTSATLNNGANVTGRVLARNGAVTLDTNVITKSSCTPTPTPTPTPTSSPTSTPVSTPTSTPSPTATPTSASTTSPLAASTSLSSAPSSTTSRPNIKTATLGLSISSGLKSASLKAVSAGSNSATAATMKKFPATGLAP